MDKQLTISALEKALAAYQAPETHHSDQGSQYATPEFANLFPKTTRISMAISGCPIDNRIAERLIKTFNEEYIDYTEHISFRDALGQIAYWMEIEYMTEGVHSALDYLTPSEFEMA